MKFFDFKDTTVTCIIQGVQLKESMIVLTMNYIDCTDLMDLVSLL